MHIPKANHGPLADEQGHTQPMHSEPTQVQAQPTKGHSQPIQGHPPHTHGHAQPIHGHPQHIQGHSQAIQGHPQHTQKHPQHTQATQGQALQNTPGQAYHPGKAPPGPLGTTIFIDGAANVTMINNEGKQVVPAGLQQEEEQKGGFLKFPSLRGKKKKKDKDKSTENLAEEPGSEDKKKKKRKKKDKGEQQAQPGTQAMVPEIWQEAMAGQPLASSETRYDQHTPQKDNVSGPLPNSPGSPEEHGIHATVMGANVERGDTVKKGQAGAYSQLKKTNAESMESLDEDSFTQDEQRSAQEQALLATQSQIGKGIKWPKQSRTGDDAAIMNKLWAEQQQVPQQPEQAGSQPGQIGYKGKRPGHAHGAPHSQGFQQPVETNLDDHLEPLPPGADQYGHQGPGHHGYHGQAIPMEGVMQETNFDDMPPNQPQFQDVAIEQVQANLQQQQQPQRQMGRRGQGTPKGPRGQQQQQDLAAQMWAQQHGIPQQPIDPNMSPQGMEMDHEPKQRVPKPWQPATETNIDDDLQGSTNQHGAPQSIDPSGTPQHPGQRPHHQDQQFQDAALGSILAQQQQPKRQMGRRAARMAQGNQGAPAGFPGSHQPQPQVVDLWAEAQRKKEAFVDEELREQEFMEQGS